MVGYALREAATSTDYVRGLTHNFYRYPARFSPEFARVAIESFSRQGDTILDPFMGGGTSIVEAMASGRRAVGVDLNSLAVFVATTKTTPLSRRDVTAVEDWLSDFPVGNVKHHDVAGRFGANAKDVPLPLRHAIAVGLDGAEMLPARAQRFARCALLRTGQWALDSRQQVPTQEQFLKALRDNSFEMLSGIAELSNVIAENTGTPASKLTSRRRLLKMSSADLREARLPDGWKAPNLVVTSPPYVGVNVLYNRWQVRGRRETPFPYSIAGTTDGQFASHYTFVHRSRPMDDYLPKLVSAFSGVRAAVSDDARVVQLVAFSDPRRQLPAYIAGMAEAGFVEDRSVGERRIWRQVPNRRWYNRTSSRHEPASREVMLVHRSA